LELFEQRSILLLISTYKEAWNITQKAETVVILDNQRYDGSEKRYIDYTIPDMLQMMGHAYVDQK
jgi:pre-mRNA-splicing helicase BRR2